MNDIFFDKIILTSANRQGIDLVSFVSYKDMKTNKIHFFGKVKHKDYFFYISSYFKSNDYIRDIRNTISIYKSELEKSYEDHFMYLEFIGGQVAAKLFFDSKQKLSLIHTRFFDFCHELSIKYNDIALLMKKFDTIDLKPALLPDVGF